MTIATTERSFSVLELLKIYLRSTVSETRLDDLAMMYIYRNLTVNIDAVIDEFAKFNRRLAVHSIAEIGLINTTVLVSQIY